MTACWHILDKSHSVHASKSSSQRKIWTKIHTFGVNSLKASIDNVKQLTGTLKKMGVSVKNGSFEVSFSSPCSSSEFQNETYIPQEDSLYMHKSSL